MPISFRRQQPEQAETPWKYGQRAIILTRQALKPLEGEFENAERFLLPQSEELKAVLQAYEAVQSNDSFDVTFPAFIEAMETALNKEGETNPLTSDNVWKRILINKQLSVIFQLAGMLAMNGDENATRIIKVLASETRTSTLAGENNKYWPENRWDHTHIQLFAVVTALWKELTKRLLSDLM